MSTLLDIDINEQLLEILGQFDLQLEKLEDYYFVNGLFPGIAAQAFEMERFEDFVVVQVDIHLLLPNNHFVESFVGQGSSVEEAVADALEQFEVNAVHTLIMAFWDDARHVENGIGTDIWEINGERWQAVISNYGYRGEIPIDEAINDLDRLYDTIVEQIHALPLEEDIYAIRTVQTNIGNGKMVTEALINNEEFFELEKAVSNLGWQPTEEYYTVRNLIILMKLHPEA